MNRKASRKLYGLIGYPVSHSLSPAIFRAAFDAEGIDADYDLYPIAPDHLDPELRRILDRGIRGLNVTVPHKSAVIQLMTDLDESARMTGAVNVIEVVPGGIVGHNTDLGGFEDSFVPLGIPDIQECQVLVLGAGGAARAVLVSLARRGASEILVANRFADEASNLVSLVAPGYPGVHFQVLPLEECEIVHAVSDTVLCVQATSLGLKETDPLPINPALLPKNCFVYDLVYGPEETAFVRSAKSQGYRTSDGKEMLLWQAAGTFRIWFRRDPPIEAMRAGIARAVKNPSVGNGEGKKVGPDPAGQTR